MMIRFNSYCLYTSLRIVNVVANLLGAAMIIYSLWLLKQWLQRVAVLPFTCALPRPWFIYVCLGVGIVVCLSTLSGHMVANCINKYILAVYIVLVFSLALLQAGLVVTILFKFDWEEKIIKCIDKYHLEFKCFVLFHLIVCRWILILILGAQISVCVIAAILWVIGGAPIIGRHVSVPCIDVTQSFLVDNDPPATDDRGLAETI